jgi:hypothetical protein
MKPPAKSKFLSGIYLIKTTFIVAGIAKMGSSRILVVDEAGCNSR